MRRLALLALALLLAGCDRTEDRDTHILIVEAGADAVLDTDLAAMALRQGLVRFGPQGDIVGALAERWHVTEDGLSYIFRLGEATWANNDPVEASEVAAALARIIENPPAIFGDEFGAVRDVRAMTDKVIEIRLDAPQPALLSLLAQPQAGVARGNLASGPYAIDTGRSEGTDASARTLRRLDADGEMQEYLTLELAEVEDALARFADDDVDMVTGGSFDSVPLAREAAGLFGGPRYDPALGLFGLVAVAEHPLLQTPELRAALSSVIDRDAFIAELGVPDLSGRTTILQADLQFADDPEAPSWTALSMEERRAAARNVLDLAELDERRVDIRLPDGPGGQLLFERLASDWSALGITLERSDDGALALVDRVAPAADAAWFLDNFTCAVARLCSEAADAALEAAHAAVTPAIREALLLDAAAVMTREALFMPIAAPVRWSLVKPDLVGFAPNRFARHDPGSLRRPIEGF